MNPSVKHFNPLIIPMIIVSLLFVGVSGFGVWAFMERSDYKNNSDQKAEEAVEDAKEAQKIELQKEFDEKEKSPTKTYVGPSAFGGVTFSYPKTWGAYVEEKGTGTSPVNGYFHPNFVPDVASETSFALRLEIKETTYDNEVKDFESAIKKGTIKLTPYRHAGDQAVLGSKLEGEIEKGKQGVVILLPLRDKVIKIWTEAPQYAPDFINIIMKDFKFNS